MGLIKFIKKIRFRFSREYCYEQMKTHGYAFLNCCPGSYGGDKLSDYLSYDCIDCLHYLPGFSAERYEKEVKNRMGKIINRDVTECSYYDKEGLGCLDCFIEVCPYQEEDTFARLRKISHMTDQEAARILRDFLKGFQFGRGNGKTLQSLRIIRAISKGIEALEENV